MLWGCITFDVLSFYGFDCDVLSCDLVVAFVYVAVLAWTDSALENVIVDYFRHIWILKGS